MEIIPQDLKGAWRGLGFFWSGQTADIFVGGDVVTPVSGNIVAVSMHLIMLSGSSVYGPIGPACSLETGRVTRTRPRELYLTQKAYGAVCIQQ